MYTSPRRNIYPCSTRILADVGNRAVLFALFALFASQKCCSLPPISSNFPPLYLIVATNLEASSDAQRRVNTLALSVIKTTMPSYRPGEDRSGPGDAYRPVPAQARSDNNGRMYGERPSGSHSRDRSRRYSPSPRRYAPAHGKT